MKEIIERIKARLAENGHTAIGTCNLAPSYGWDLTEYRLMPVIANKLRAEGVHVTQSTNHGVIDWVFVATDV